MAQNAYCFLSLALRHTVGEVDYYYTPMTRMEFWESVYLFLFLQIASFASVHTMHILYLTILVRTANIICGLKTVCHQTSAYSSEKYFVL